MSKHTFFSYLTTLIYLVSICRSQSTDADANATSAESTTDAAASSSANSAPTTGATPQAYFTTPSQDDNDFTSQWKNNDTIYLTWTKDASWTGGMAQLEVAFYQNNDFTKEITAHIDLRNVGNYQWRIADSINDTVIDKDVRFVLRMTPDSGTNEDWGFSSRGFLVVKASDPNPVVPSPSSSETAQSNGSSALSGGAIAGIVVGALAVISFVVLGAWLLRKRYRGRRPRAVSKSSPAEEVNLQSQLYDVQEIDGHLSLGTTQRYTELDAPNRSELVAMKNRPGSHELEAP